MKLNPSGVFLVTSYYDYINEELEEVNFSTRLIWKAKATPRIDLFALEIIRECILTLDNLIEREKVFVNGCYYARVE